MDGFAPGQIIDGRYRVIGMLGEGAMGVVFRASHTQMERQVAIKLLKSALLTDPDKVNRFVREARTVSRLKHRNIVNVYSVGTTDDGQPYLAMEYLQGNQLSDLISEHGFLQPSESLPIFIQVCEGLAHAHKHEIVHRDIKPSNIMVVVENGLQTPKIVDFGIARSIAPDVQALTQTGLMMGSAFYMSPDQCLGGAPDVRSDVYSLGCTLYETLTGRPPLQGENVLETLSKQVSEEPLPLGDANPDLGPCVGLQTVLTCMMQKDPSSRYQSMETLKQDLQRVLSGEAPSHVQESPSITIAPKTSERGTTAGFAIAAIAVCVLALCFYLLAKEPQGRLGAKMDTVALTAKASGLEQIGQQQEAIALYEQALEQAIAARDVNTTAEMQRRIAWAFHKIWEADGKKESDTESERVALSWARRAVSTVEPQVYEVDTQEKRFPDYQFKERLTLLATCYDTTGRIAIGLRDIEERSDMCCRLATLYKKFNQNFVRRDSVRAMYMKALDYLIKHDAEIGQLESGKTYFADFEQVMKEHFMDPADATALTAQYKRLLKLAS